MKLVRIMKATALLLLSLAMSSSGLAAGPPRPSPSLLPDQEPRKTSGITQTHRHPNVERYRKARTLSPQASWSDWPYFLGPTRNGISPETGLRQDFGPPASGQAGPLLVWALSKGQSYSAPSVKGRRLVYCHRVGNAEMIECLDAETGDLFWSTNYPTSYVDRYGYLNGPRATPTIDGDRVYVLGAQGVLTCLDLKSGQQYWQRALAAEFDLDQGFFGFCTSPLIEADLLILNLGRDHTVAAFDKLTGKLRWSSGNQWGRSYATPVAATMFGKRLLFVFAGGMTKPPVGGLLGLDARTGRIRFHFPWRSRRYFSANASSPVVSGNQVFVSSSYDIEGALLEIKPDLTHQVVYQGKSFGSHWMTPILYQGHLYGFANSRLTCMEWTSGKRLWRQTIRLPGRDSRGGSRDLGTGRGADQYREPPGRRGFGIGSLIQVDGRFLCLGETGLLAWLDLSPQGCRILAARRLFNADQTWTAPVISRGLLYVTQNLPDQKTPPRLLCYDLRAGEGGP